MKGKELLRSFFTPFRIAVISISILLLSFVVYASSDRDNHMDNYPGTGETIKWYSFNDALDEAKKINKAILIDFYTDWCHWCDVMDEKTYTNDQVKELIKEKFIPVKFDAESDKEVKYKNRSIPQVKLARELGVTGYPTTFFLESDGSIIGGQPGYLEPENFIKLLTFVANKEYLKKK